MQRGETKEEILALATENIDRGGVLCFHVKSQNLNIEATHKAQQIIGDRIIFDRQIPFVNSNGLGVDDIAWMTLT